MPHTFINNKKMKQETIWYYAISSDGYIVWRSISYFLLFFVPIFMYVIVSSLLSTQKFVWARKKLQMVTLLSSWKGNLFSELE